MQRFNFNKVTSGLILTLLLVTVVSFAGQVNAQAPPDMSQMPGGGPKMVSAGAYSNSDYGFQMTLPDGWTGMEMKTPQFTQLSMGLSDTPDVSMTALMGPPALGSQGAADNPNVPIDPKYKCDVPTADNTNVNGLSGTVSVIQCTSPEGVQKMKVYSLHSETAGIILFFSVPLSKYDSNVGTFDSVVNTLQIANAAGASSQSQSTGSAQNPTSDATVPEFPTIASLILVVSIFAIIGFTMVSRKNGLFLFGRY